MSVKKIIKMKTTVQTIAVENLIPHPYHLSIYNAGATDNLQASLTRTGNTSVYPITAIPFKDGLYYVISGVLRLDALINLGVKEVDVQVYDIDDEQIIKDLIVDLNKQRIKTGRELMMEFRHYLEKYPQKKGVPGNRYEKIGRELNISSDRVKELSMMNTFFTGDGDVIIESIFGGDLALNQAKKLKKIVEQYPEKFDSPESFIKVCNRDFDYKRLGEGIEYIDINKDTEFDILKSYSTGSMNDKEFENRLVQMEKITKKIDSHIENKVIVPDLGEIGKEYRTKHSRLINGDNRKVALPFHRMINCLIGSPPYGDRRSNGDNPESETGHRMTGSEYGRYLAETYAEYIPFMAPDGSIYVIIDDFRLKNGALASSLEHFVVEMENRGVYLVERMVWWKNNGMPRNYADKDMVANFEMIYRFSPTPYEYYTNPDMFLEMDNHPAIKVSQGATNHSKNGITTRGGTYVQSHLKKIRNTLDESTCIDIIRGNVANPEDFFRLTGEKKHTSTAPIYLTAALILNSTKPGDLCVDIWNGVGGTMVSALLLQRDYIGIEKESNYYTQTVRRAVATEGIISITVLTEYILKCYSITTESVMKDMEQLPDYPFTIGAGLRRICTHHLLSKAA
jgi:DNA modification methylase